MTTITALTDLSKLPNQSQDQAVFDANFAYLVENLPLRAQQENALAANLNSIAAGGAYAIPYNVHGSTRALVFAGGATQSASTYITADFVAADGSNYQPMLSNLAASSSAVKGAIRLQKVGDPSKWIAFYVTSVTTAANYAAIFVTPAGGSEASPFAVNDLVMLFFDRTGDKGDTGPQGSVLLPIFHLREQYANTVAGPLLASGTTTCALNTVVLNTFSNGVSLSGNQLTLAAGVYEIDGFAVMRLTGEFRSLLYSVTDGSVLAYGSPGSAGPNQYTDTVLSRISGRITLASQKTLELRRVANSNGTAGAPAGGGIEFYSELIVRKVA